MTLGIEKEDSANLESEYGADIIECHWKIRVHRIRAYFL